MKVLFSSVNMSTIYEHLIRGYCTESCGIDQVPNDVVTMLILFFGVFFDVEIGSSMLSKNNLKLLIDCLSQKLRVSDLGDIEVLFNSNLHGWSAAQFHAKCDHIAGPTITLVETESSLFGGYTNVQLDVPRRIQSGRGRIFVFHYERASDTTVDDVCQRFEAKIRSASSRQVFVLWALVWNKRRHAPFERTSRQKRQMLFYIV